ncbi:CIR protein PIR protein [Plasmodium vinckei vinckei]|uniref:CIR protein PIR protein n=1 Tax=Plasmodium vinckei vinckei TaxID=54757 RepID=A0A449BM96_PLAVN|nr:CIR protein PIR protein [Plasmodium vinckei vinckei]VEV54543.1 CIR protein PIR protein [Plasmodium vinckei vinckei]
MEAYAFNLFREVDELFESKSVNVRKFYNDTRITQYCPEQDGGYKSCYSDYERINAIGAYVFMELIGKNQNFNGSNDERYISYFIMWISHILYRKFEDNSFTLNSIYDKHLKNNFGNFSYWNLLQNKMYLTNSNIAIMNVLYFLFQNILDTIKKVQTKDIQPHEYPQKALEFYVIYNKLFKHISPCGPYRKLLNHLKTTYNNFIETARQENIHREDILNQLIELSPKEKPFKNNFNTKGCEKIHNKLKNNSSKLIQLGNSMLKDYSERKAQSTPNSPESQDMGFYYYYNHNNGDDDDDDEDNEDNGDEDNDDLEIPKDTKGSLSTDTDNQNHTLDPKQGNSTDVSENGTQMKTSQMNDPSASSKSASQGDPPGDTKKTETRNKDNIAPIQIEDPPTPFPMAMKQTQDDNSQQSHQITDSNIPGGASTTSNSGTKDTGNIKGPQENKQGATGDEQKDSGGGKDDKGGQVGGSNGDQRSQEGLGGSGDGPGSDPVENGPQSTSWPYFGIGSYISTIASKGKEQLNNAVISLETIKKKVTEATTNTIQNIYSKSMSNIQAAYDKSRNLLHGTIDNINSYSKKVANIFIQNDDQSGSGGTGGGVPTPNDSLSSQKNLPQSSSGTPPTTLPLPDPKEQTNPLQSSQDSPGNQNSDKNHQGGSKIQVGITVVKQEDTGTEVKGNKTTGIGDIYVLKEYKQIGISIIVLLIPIALSIMYKYLSYGWRKKLKRKKTMKKVINSIGGKRPVQIIICSSIHKKQPKKSINSVHRKKPPLLNIYKLMQADPIPFINLFFLLIFFVYKRKSDFLEL